MRAGLYYNPYMPGGKIATCAAIEDLVEYGDGTGYGRRSVRYHTFPELDGRA